MDKKEFLKEIAGSFFIISTLINIAIFILGSLFNGDARFGYEAFLSPLIYAAFSLLPVAVTYTEKKLSLKESIIRKVIQLALIEVILFLFGFGIRNIKKSDPMLLVGVGLSIAVIYVLVLMIKWFTASRKAKALTEELKEFQKDYMER